MKMTKKIFLGAVAVMAFALVGCAGFGDSKTSGTKTKKSFELDATDTEMTEKYSRAFSTIRGTGNCSTLSTVITVDKEESILVGDSSRAVIGLAFDVHTTKDKEAGDSFYDFVLVGIQADTAKYYVERYTGVSVNKLKETMKTDESDIDTAANTTFLDGKASEAFYCDAPIAAVEDEDGNKTWAVEVTQDEAFTYVVKINDTEVAKYTVAEEDQVEGKMKSKGKQVGSVYAYGNAPKGSKIKATYNTDSKASVGFYEDAE